MVAWGIGGLAAGVAFVWVVTWSRRRPARRIGLSVAAAAAMGLSALAAVTGLLQQMDRVPPPMALMIGLVFAMAGGLGLSRLGAAIAVEVPLMTVVALQSFRLPLELVMHRAGSLGIMPPELSYGGYNFDIVTGIGAVGLWGLARIGVAIPRPALWLWNIWGLYCLAVIAAIAVATSPMVRWFGDDPRHVNTWVLYMPYVWLPVVLVTIAIASHLVVTRQLLQDR
jgi:hypothetical protein